MEILIDISPPRTGNVFRWNEIFPKIKDADVVRSIHILKYMYTVKEFVTPYEKLDLLKKHYPDAFVFYVDREKNSWIVSLYNHWVKYDGTLSFDDWYSTILDTMVFDTDKLIEYARKVFNNNFYLLNFERFIKEPEIEFNRLLSFFGLNTITVSNNKHNASFTYRQVGLCRVLNKVFNKHCVGRNWVKLLSK